MDDRDEVSDTDAGAARGEVPWEYDFTLARVRRPRLLRPSPLDHPERTPVLLRDTPEQRVAPVVDHSAGSATTTDAGPGDGAASRPAPHPDTSLLPTLPPGFDAVEDTIQLSDGVPAALGPRPAAPPASAPSPAAPPASAPSPAAAPAPAPRPTAAPAPAPRPAAPPAPAPSPATPPAPGPRSARRRWSAHRTELVVKVTCGIALVTGTAALVVLALAG